MAEPQTNEEVVDELITGRRAVYGDPEETFKEHAIVWSVIFGVEVRPDQVALALVAYKMLRANRTPDYSDNIDDVIGYADIFKKVQGDRMINARSVDDYLEQKQLRDRGVLEFFRAESADQFRERLGFNPNQKITATRDLDIEEPTQHLPERGCCGCNVD